MSTSMTSPSPSTKLWVRFSDNDSVTVEQVGGKGLGLLQSQRAGFNVPDGFVLTTTFFDPWIEQVKATEEFHTHVADKSRDACDALKALCNTLSLTKEQKNALNEASDSISSMLVAVRSSAPHEDSAGASFAGMYHSTLSVPMERGEYLIQAIRDSFASMFDYRVASMLKNLSASDLSFAVVVQHQVDAAVSGVAFSLDPLSNCYDEAVIGANFGLGETVVGGLVTPDTYKVDKFKRTITSKQVSANKTLSHVINQDGGFGVREQPVLNPSIQALSDEQILRVADLVTDVEKSRGGEPVDIEWCFGQDGILYLLQARPITSYVKLFPEMVTQPREIKQLYMDGIIASQGFSSPMSVLGIDIWGRMVEKVLPHYSHGEDGLVWEIHGREYVILSRILAMRNGDSMLNKVAEASGAHVRRALETIDFDDYRPEAVTQKNKYFLFATFKFMLGLAAAVMWGLWNPDKAFDSYNKGWQELFEQYKVGGPGDEDDLTFSEEVDNSMTRICNLFAKQMCVLATYYYKWRLGRIFAGDADIEKLLVALDMDLNGNPTSEMGHAMLDIASFTEVQDCPSGQALVEKLEKNEVSPEVSAAVTSFVAKFGCRGMREIDIATPRSSEDLAALIDRIKQIDVADNQILKMVDRKKQVMETLQTRARAIGYEKQFLYYASVIQKMGGYREHPKYVFVFMLAHLRRRALKLGERLVAEGRLPDVASIFDLTLEQLAEAERDSSCDLLAWISQNNAPYIEVANVKDWPLLIDSRGKIVRGKRDDVEGGLGGDPISPGITSGRARVLDSPDGEPLGRGDILVTKAAEPSWTPIFINASAVVLEVGGPTQHGAIIAREYGIPCVSGVEDATKLIKDGQMIEVDGASGVVRFLDGELTGDGKH
ncbi:hypothetical protein MPSEU_001044900 [Mayamaea pseudoterrestris]|nr:hypothetical protein MPSEU_001044900 [Mayamaea pseudoterrestris]